MSVSFLSYCLKITFIWLSSPQIWSERFFQWSYGVIYCISHRRSISVSTLRWRHFPWLCVLVSRTLRWTESWSWQWSASWRRCWEIQTFCLRREKLPPTFWGKRQALLCRCFTYIHFFVVFSFKLFFFVLPQHSFSRWAGGRPVENRGHLTDGGRTTLAIYR